MKDRATEALLKCGLSMNLKGFHYIVDAMCLLDEGWFGKKFMVLYAEIAKINNSTPSRVERALRLALEIILTKCPLEEVSMYFDLQNKTNSAQLTCFYYRLCEEREKANKVELSTINCGDIFKIGEHDFIVLKQDTQNHTTKVISKGFMAEDKVFDNDTRDYNKSSLKKLIEKDIQPIIENAIGADNLVEHEVDLTSVDMQNEFGKCKCKVRPITFDEAREFNDYLVNKNLDDYWWTCTSWSTADRGYKYSMAVVSLSGIVCVSRCYGFRGVRPFCILKSNIFVSKGEQSIWQKH